MLSHFKLLPEPTPFLVTSHFLVSFTLTLIVLDPKCKTWKLVMNTSIDLIIDLFCGTVGQGEAYLILAWIQIILI